MRFLAIATVIVLGLIAVITSLPHARPLPSATVMFSSSTASPGPAQNDDGAGTTPPPMLGEAPWALSSLPECFRQVSRRDGTPAFARRGLPASAKLVTAGTRLRFGDCAVETSLDTVAVTRGEDRLVVPASAHLYRSANRLILERTADGRGELRTYAFTAPVARASR